MQVLSLVHSRRDLARRPKHIIFVDDEEEGARRIWICSMEDRLNFVLARNMHHAESHQPLLQMRHGNFRVYPRSGWKCCR